MLLDDYQNLAMKTAKEFDSWIDAAMYGTIKLSGEAGEFSNVIGKAIYHARPLAKEQVVEELGDILWYVAFLAKAFNVTLSDIARANIDKLQARHGEKYNSEFYSRWEVE